MTLSDLFTSLETSRKLVEAGVSISTLFYHKDGSHITRENYMVSPPSYQQGCTPAFTAQELAEWFYNHIKEKDGVPKPFLQVWMDHEQNHPLDLVKPQKWAKLILHVISQNIITPRK